MKKEDVFVIVDSEKKKEKVIKILESAGERIWDDGCGLILSKTKKYFRCDQAGDWFLMSFVEIDKHVEVSIEELENFLLSGDDCDEKAKELIEKFKPFAYPFAGGSGFMTGEVCEETILSGGKELASMAAQTVVDNIGQDHPKWSFWVGVVDAIKNYKVVNPNQTELELEG